LIWADLCRALKQEIPIQVLMDSFIHTPLDHEMMALAKRVKSQGYKVGMITDNKADRIKAVSDEWGFDELFDVICISASVGLSKSGKEIFWDTLGKIGVNAEESLFIDNNPQNLVIPRELGMSVIHFDHDERDYVGLINQLQKEGVKIDA
jgi:putative hydrolase of the HAD superfamily